MTDTQRKWTMRLIALAIVVAMAIAAFEVLRRSLLILVALAAIGLIVVVMIKIRAGRKTKVIFGFYVAANEILVDGDKSRYHFEIAQVIKTGERIVRSMPDAPPLSRFALGALYYSIGDHNAAVEQLGFAAEEEVLKESRHATPSRQLRRYVAKLRRIERRPKLYAKLNAAIASLERMHQERGARLLAESQQQLKRMVEAYEGEMSEQIRSPRKDLPISNSRSLKSITAPPTISEVLNEVYQEDR
jgi:hypothetical protein